MAKNEVKDTQNETSALDAILERIERLEEENKNTKKENDELRKKLAAVDNKTVAEPQKDPFLDLVRIKLFKDDDRYKDDVVVTVNGRRFQIQRGVEVDVPRPVYEVLENSRKQKEKSDEYKRLLAEEFAKMSR